MKTRSLLADSELGVSFPMQSDGQTSRI